MDPDRSGSVLPGTERAVPPGTKRKTPSPKGTASNFQQGRVLSGPTGTPSTWIPEGTEVLVRQVCRRPLVYLHRPAVAVTLPLGAHLVVPSPAREKSPGFFLARRGSFHPPVAATPCGKLLRVFSLSPCAGQARLLDVSRQSHTVTITLSGADGADPVPYPRSIDFPLNLRVVTVAPRKGVSPRAL